MKPTLKYFLIAAICGLLLIPVFFISQLISDKQQRSTDAVKEVANKWGSSQVIAGPFVSATEYIMGASKEQIPQSVFLFPKSVMANTTLNCSKRHRGIYDIDLYTAKVKLNGVFDSIDVSTISENNMVNVNLFISDLKGLTSDVKVKIDGKNYDFASGLVENDLGNTGIHFSVNYQAIKNKTYEIEFELNGSSSISFVPLGKTNSIKLAGNWSNPSFAGSFLPTNHSITTKDFTAEWKILSLNKSFSQIGKGAFVNFSNYENEINYDYAPSSNQGQYCMTRIFNPVTDYTKARRANQYAFFLLIIVFVALFLAEYISKSNIHLIQYAIIGSAIVLFYLFLLSLSEHLGFNKAYLFSALMVVIPTFFYTKSILNSMKAATVISGLTMLLYAMFFIMLLSQDYSLLIGSLLAFIILISVMFITRNFNKSASVSETN